MQNSKDSVARQPNLSTLRVAHDRDERVHEDDGLGHGDEDEEDALEAGPPKPAFRELPKPSTCALSRVSGRSVSKKLCRNIAFFEITCFETSK